MYRDQIYVRLWMAGLCVYCLMCAGLRASPFVCDYTCHNIYDWAYNSNNTVTFFKYRESECIFCTAGLCRWTDPPTGGTCQQVPGPIKHQIKTDCTGTQYCDF